MPERADSSNPGPWQCAHRQRPYRMLFVIQLRAFHTCRLSDFERFLIKIRVQKHVCVFFLSTCLISNVGWFTKKNPAKRGRLETVNTFN
jgi:hypothetical protein